MPSGEASTIRLPPLRGHWVDTRCVFTDTHRWLLVATQVQGKMVRQCVLLSAQAEQYDGSWLFAPTDEGIVRVEPQHGQLVQTRVFPDTEPFVDSGCHLFAGQQGMYVIDRQSIDLLSIA